MSKDLIPLSPEDTFGLSIAALQKQMEPYANLEITDFNDAKQIIPLGAALRDLQKMRTTITSAGKRGREASNAYNKAVLAIEKELLACVTPIENRLKKYEEMRALLELRNINKTKLFDRQTALKELGETIDETRLLDMTDDQFDAEIKSIQKRLTTLAPKITVDLAGPAGETFFYSGDPAEAIRPRMGLSPSGWKKTISIVGTAILSDGDNVLCGTDFPDASQSDKHKQVNIVLHSLGFDPKTQIYSVVDSQVKIYSCVATHVII